MALALNLGNRGFMSNYLNYSLKKGEAVITEALADKLNRAPIQTQRFCCGILKLLYPSNGFSGWVGIITTQKRLAHIQWALRKYQPKRGKARTGLTNTPKFRPRVHY